MTNLTHEGFIGKRLVTAEPYIYTVFRVLIGLLYSMHGAAKVFGWFSVKSLQATGSLMWFIGIVEILVGLFIVFGLWTRLAALTGTIIMITAWFKVHVAMGWNPLANYGEPVVLFLAAFLVLLIYGSGKYGIEHCMHKKECI